MAAPPPEGPSLANPGEEMERSLVQGWASSGETHLSGQRMPHNLGCCWRGSREMDTGGRQRCPHKSGDHGKDTRTRAGDVSFVTSTAYCTAPQGNVSQLAQLTAGKQSSRGPAHTGASTASPTHNKVPELTNIRTRHPTEK